MLSGGEQRDIPRNAPTSPQLFLSKWVYEHERNLPGSAQVGPGLPLLVWDGPLLSEECGAEMPGLPMVGEGDGQRLLGPTPTFISTARRPLLSRC